MIGLLDGLHLQPLVDADGKLTHVHCTVDTLPGLRLIVEAAAVAELHAALGTLLAMSPEQPRVCATCLRRIATDVDLKRLEREADPSPMVAEVSTSGGTWLTHTGWSGDICWIGDPKLCKRTARAEAP